MDSDEDTFSVLYCREGTSNIRSIDDYSCSDSSSDSCDDLGDFGTTEELQELRALQVRHKKLREERLHKRRDGSKKPQSLKKMADPLAMDGHHPELLADPKAEIFVSSGRRAELARKKHERNRVLLGDESVSSRRRNASGSALQSAGEEPRRRRRSVRDKHSSLGREDASSCDDDDDSSEEHDDEIVSAARSRIETSRHLCHRGGGELAATER
jgi:hypothetical protein